MEILKLKKVVKTLNAKKYISYIFTFNPLRLDQKEKIIYYISVIPKGLKKKDKASKQTDLKLLIKEEPETNKYPCRDGRLLPSSVVRVRKPKSACRRYTF